MSQTLAERPESSPAPWLRWLPWLAPWLVGLAFALAFVPLGYLDGSAALLQRPDGDFIQHQTGIVGYLHDTWRWPPFHTLLLDAPDGTSLVFVDALPGPSLLAKLVLTLTGLEIPVLGWWIFALYLLQPVGMARLLRALGVEAALPLLAGSLIALACSWFLWRFGHSALNGHFLLLFGLAFAVEAGQDGKPRRALARLGLLALGCLFVHAYLFAMNAALFVALAAGLALRRRGAWRQALAALALWLAATAAAMALLGYFSFSKPLGGYGRYGMNLLSPFVPQMSGLWPDFARQLWTSDRPPMGDWRVLDGVMPLPGAGDMLDATTGQYEGYAWFGFGLWPLLALALGLRWRRLPVLLRRHWPLLLATLGMAFFAASPRFWVAYGPWFSLDIFPEELKAFRSNGRFIWPLVYLGAAAAVAGVAPHLGRRWVGGALVALTLLQLADARLWYDRLWRLLRSEPSFVLAAETWQPLIAAHERVLVHTKLFCRGADWEVTRQAAFHAAAVGRPIDDMHISRGRDHNCRGEALSLVGFRPPPRTLLVLSGAFQRFQAGLLPPDVTRTCRAFDQGLACSDLWDELETAGLAESFVPRRR
jgi:hypothetical protein